MSLVIQSLMSVGQQDHLFDWSLSRSNIPETSYPNVSYLLYTFIHFSYTFPVIAFFLPLLNYFPFWCREKKGSARKGGGSARARRKVGSLSFLPFSPPSHAAFFLKWDQNKKFDFWEVKTQILRGVRDAYRGGCSRKSMEMQTFFAAASCKILFRHRR